MPAGTSPDNAATLETEGPVAFDDIAAYIEAVGGEQEFWRRDGDKRLFKFRFDANKITISMAVWVNDRLAGADRQLVLNLMQTAHKIRASLIGGKTKNGG